jgi:hypothetical protein
MDTGGRCDLCGDRDSDGDPVVDYTDGQAHIECAQEEGWED